MRSPFASGQPIPEGLGVKSSCCDGSRMEELEPGSWSGESPGEAVIMSKWLFPRPVTLCCQCSNYLLWISLLATLLGFKSYLYHSLLRKPLAHSSVSSCDKEGTSPNWEEP